MTAYSTEKPATPVAPMGPSHNVPTGSLKSDAAKPNGPRAGSLDSAGMRSYVELTRLIERMHRRFLDVLRINLQRAGVTEINAVQCLMLSNIGEQEINARLLMDRGYYLGSNASYNIKRLVETGYLEQRQAEHDRRSTLLRVSAKGRAICDRMSAAETSFAEAMRQEDLTVGIDILRRIERVWDDFLTR